MPESPLIQIETESLKELEALIAARAKGESEVESGFQRRREREEKEYRAAAQQVVGKYKVDHESLEAEYKRTKEEVQRTFARNSQACDAEYAQTKQQVEDQFKKEQKRGKKAKEETGWHALTVFEGTRDEGVKWRRGTEANWGQAIQELEALKYHAEQTLKKCGGLGKATPEQEAAILSRSAATGTVEPLMSAAPAVKPSEGGAEAGGDGAEAAAPIEDNPLTQLQSAMSRIIDGSESLERLKLPKFLRPEAFIWPFLILGAAVAAGLALGAGLSGVIAGVVGGVVTVGSAVGARIALVGKAKTAVLEHAVPLRKTITDADQLVEQSKDWIKLAYDEKLKEFEQRRADKVQEGEDKMARLVAEAKERYRQEILKADTKYPPIQAEIAKRRDEELKKADETYPPRIAARKEKYEKDRKAVDDAYATTKQATTAEYERIWNAIIKDWTEGMGQVDGALKNVNQEGSERFLDWFRPDLDEWKPPTKVPPGLQFGRFGVELSQFTDGMPRDPRLKSVPTSFNLPALIPFPIQGSVLIKAADAGRDTAVNVLQTLMLRYLTSVPPGKTRFTIVDPVGLGENFAAFMHLGDYSELLVTNRIWTEAKDIEQRLTDLTEHMENVIQKYLRNEFETIEQYNTMAGEVAEPFRVLVIANFPTNFNETSLRRLISIVSSGARCGVYALIFQDTKLSLPSGFQLKDLESQCVNMIWKENRLSWREPNLGRFPLKLDGPPDQVRFSQLMHRMGVAARDANRVEVPFEFIAPKPEQYWTYSSAKTVDIPLGRSGATKLQHMILGKGTSQHVLTSGKTGSGKSTMLHALITNGALRYSPNELELYLIDFKKGVEFKVYAAMGLPHARVIAVESEREFGLSVLQRLDVELKERGEIYRKVGVQDLAGYRQAVPDVPMPRVLLVVDEFQEFFIEDDKIAQEVTLLLDRLVRQGRAFGMHVVLGSQTLGGSYSLPRATLGQMAVRIALQCSEADAHLILSEDNTAARLLTRPGEAIYNDANGMMEGNNLFQVVWLPDERREKFLERIQEMTIEQNIQKAPPIVFEGNLPADVSRNPLLNRLLEATEWGEAPRADYAWFGDAIAIKDPTAVVFRPQSGSNVVIVGQNDEAALAMMMMGVISIAAQHPPVGPGAARFYLLDGSPVDSMLSGQLDGLRKVLPHSIQSVTWRDLGEAFTEVAREIERRQKSAGEDQSPIYVFIHDLQRFRDLRKSDDDFGYSRYDEDKPVPPSKRFGDILRDGPPVGVHTVVWCDSVNNMNRTFDRQGLREFENRILFQMSANDSSTLIDTPAGSKVGENRALYYSEEANKVEKFRPYGIPEGEWLQKVKKWLSDRPVSGEAPGKIGGGDVGDGAGSSPSAMLAADAGAGASLGVDALNQRIESATEEIEAFKPEPVIEPIGVAEFGLNDAGMMGGAAQSHTSDASHEIAAEDGEMDFASEMEAIMRAAAASVEQDFPAAHYAAPLPREAEVEGPIDLENGLSFADLSHASQGDVAQQMPPLEMDELIVGNGAVDSGVSHVEEVEIPISLDEIEQPVKHVSAEMPLSNDHVGGGGYGDLIDIEEAALPVPSNGDRALDSAPLALDDLLDLDDEPEPKKAAVKPANGSAGAHAGAAEEAEDTFELL